MIYAGLSAIETSITVMKPVYRIIEHIPCHYGWGCQSLLLFCIHGGIKIARSSIIGCRATTQHTRVVSHHPPVQTATYLGQFL